MDFFKSVFAEEPDSPKSETESESESKSPRAQNLPDPNPPMDTSGGWSLGGLMKTLSTKSESVIDAYRRDLKEFQSGLKKEIEVAQGSLGNVSLKIDELGSSVIKGTAQIISQSREAILAVDLDSDIDRNVSSPISRRYNRFDTLLRGVQGDVRTYCEEPEDAEEYEKWKLGFVLDEKKEERERLIEENGDMESVYKRVVPSSVNEETFWCRYYYKVYKLEQAESLRANLVRRATSVVEEEEDLSWDIDEDEEEEQEKGNVKPGSEDLVQVVKDEEGKKNVELEEGNVSKKKDLDGEEFAKVAKDEKSGDDKREAGSNVTVGVKKDEDEKVGVDGNGEEKELAKITKDDAISDVTVGVKKDEDEKVGVDGNGEEKELAKITKDDAISDVTVGVKKDEDEKVGVDGNGEEKELVKITKDDAISDDKQDLKKSEDEGVLKSDEKVSVERKGENGESSKESEFSAVTSHQSMGGEEEDLEWDEIEDLSSIDEKKVARNSGGSPNKDDLRKRLSASEEEEDLSWDIEDDDDDDAPVKA